MNGRVDRILLDSVQLRGVYTDPQEFAAKLNWKGRKIYWGFNPPNPSRQFQPWNWSGLGYFAMFCHHAAAAAIKLLSFLI